MTTVNSRYLAFSDAEQNINVSAGFTVHVLDYKNMKSLVAVISEYQGLSWTDQISDPGTGTLTLDEDDPAWGSMLNNNQSHRALQDKEYVFEIWDRDVPRFAFLGKYVTNGNVGDDETRSVSITGPGAAVVLKWACILRPGWPTKAPILGYKPTNAKNKDGTPADPIPVYRVNSYNDKLPAFLWRFPIRWPSMRMWWTVFKAAQRRGLLSFVTPRFTAFSDSQAQPWVDFTTIDEIAEQEGYQPTEPAMNLLDFLADCTGQDNSKWFGQRLEWHMDPGFKLRVQTTIGQDRSDRVRFYQGNVTSASRTRDRENIFNRLVVTDVDGNERNVTDAQSVARWNLREQRNETHKNVTDPKQVAYIADRLLKQQKDEKDEWTLKIPYDDPGRVPYRHFLLGDTVGVNVAFDGWLPRNSSTPAKYRVMAITISITQDQTVPDVELTLQDVIASKMVDMERQITRLINEPVGFNLDKIKDTTGLTELDKDGKVKALVYNPVTKKWEPQATDEFGGGGGGAVYVQKDDPAVGATIPVGAFWLKTTT